jgi:hypothetical protein
MGYPDAAIEVYAAAVRAKFKGGIRLEQALIIMGKEYLARSKHLSWQQVVHDSAVLAVFINV